MSMTALGATNILGGETRKLEGNDAQNAKNWFLGNVSEKSESGHSSGNLLKNPQEF
jgi:hypothetical protein